MTSARFRKLVNEIHQLCGFADRAGRVMRVGGVKE